MLRRGLHHFLLAVCHFRVMLDKEAYEVGAFLYPSLRQMQRSQFIVVLGCRIRAMTTRNNYESTPPLHWAVRTGSVDLARLLVGHGGT